MFEVHASPTHPMPSWVYNTPVFVLLDSKMRFPADVVAISNSRVNTHKEDMLLTPAVNISLEQLQI